MGLETDSDIGLVAWGRIGGIGQSNERSRNHVAQMMTEKLKKGYVDKTDEIPEYLVDFYFPRMSKILDKWNRGKQQHREGREGVQQRPAKPRLMNRYGLLNWWNFSEEA